MNALAQPKWNPKKLRPLFEFALVTIADFLFPGSGIVIKLCFLMWDLLKGKEQSS